MIEMICKENAGSKTEEMAKKNVYYVVHPLHDQPEAKRNTDGLGQIKLTPCVKYSLMSLRLYLILMVGLVLFRVLTQIKVI